MSALSGTFQGVFAWSAISSGNVDVAIGSQTRSDNDAREIFNAVDAIAGASDSEEWEMMWTTSHSGRRLKSARKVVARAASLTGREGGGKHMGGSVQGKRGGIVSCEVFVSNPDMS